MRSFRSSIKQAASWGHYSETQPARGIRDSTAAFYLQYCIELREPLTA